MEFRKCPACEASVLEDDAVDCPFCGASMSGKPQSAAAKAAPSKPTKPAAKAATKPAPAATGRTTAPAAEKPAPGRQLATKAAVATKSPESGDADPFDVDTSVIAQAPPMSPRPSKGRMIRIVCPMCETPGFIAPQMQGRDVKCCNPQCLVPVFKSPRPQRQVEQVEQPARVSAKMLLGGVAGALVLGALVWLLLIRDSGPARFVPPSEPVVHSPPTSESATSAVEEAAEAASPAPTRITLAEIQQQALALGVEAALDRDGNRSKPYCRRMMAEAFAQVGDLKEARHQLDRLQKVTPEPFYRVEPLVGIAWQQLGAGNRAAAAKTVSEAFDAAKDFPPYGRAPVEAVMAAGAALTAVDRIPDAHEVVRRLNRDDDTAISRERVAALVQIAFDLRMFDVDKLLEFSSLDMASEPVAIAVTTGVAGQGDWNRAIAWALSAQQSVTQEDCLAAAAVVAGRQNTSSGKPSPVTAVTEAAKQLSVAGQSRTAAGVATGALLRDDRATAAAALEQALALLEEIPRPKAIARPDVKRIHDAADEPNYGLPDAAAYRSAAIGAAQMARLQVLLGEKEAAWTTFLKAWDFTQGMGPEWETTSKLAEEIAKHRTQAAARVRRDLGISNQDLATRAFNKYARSGRRWGEAAEERFQLEVSLLREAIRWELLDQVAAVLENPQGAIPSASGQPYASTALVSTLAEAYSAAGNDERSRAIADKAKQQRVASEPIAPLIAETQRLFRSKKYLEAAKALGDFQADGRHDVEQQRDLRAMQLTCRILKLKQPDRYFPFILALKDSVLTEDCLELSAALAVREGLAIDLWERYEAARLTSTQRVAFFRGLIAGIAAMQTTETPAKAQAAGPASGTVR